MKILEDATVTNNSWLDFGNDPLHDTETGIFTGVSTIATFLFLGAILRILLITQRKFLTNSYEIFLSGRISHWQQTIWFGGHPNHDLDPGNFNRILREGTIIFNEFCGIHLHRRRCLRSQPERFRRSSCSHSFGLRILFDINKSSATE